MILTEHLRILSTAVSCITDVIEATLKWIVFTHQKKSNVTAVHSF